MRAKPGTAAAHPVYTWRVMHLSEVEAVARARRGDPSAYAALVEDNQQAAFRAAYLILRDAAAAEDVAQEAFVRAYRNLAAFREYDAFRPWLLRIVTNLALNEHRARRRRAGLGERLAGLLRPVAGPPADASLVAGEQASTLASAIDRLPANDRVILHLRYFLELDEEEMARVINRSRGTVKSRLHRAGRRLRELIEREFPDLRD